MAVHFFEENIQAKLQQKRALKTFITEQLHHYLELKTIHINFVFCSDEALLERNITYLEHDTLTDIITFDLSETTEDLISDIFISVDRIKDNAVQFGTTYENELHRVIFHGILHLIGYGDKNPEDQAEMKKMENTLLAAYFPTSNT